MGNIDPVIRKREREYLFENIKFYNLYAVILS
jgi:hypothetical protein